ncbi:steamer duck [Carabus blaptoides fortunei]
MLKEIIYLASLLVAASATGDLIILSHPKSITFKGHEHIEESTLKEMYSAALGFTVEQSSSWSGMYLVDPFHLADAVVSVVVDGVSDIGSELGHHYPLHTNEDEESTWYALEKRILERYPESENNLIRVELDQGQEAVKQYKILNQIKANSDIKPKYLKSNVEEDQSFLNEINLLNNIIAQIEVGSRKKDNARDVYWFILSGLHAVSDLHGDNSSETIEAKQLLVQTLSKLNDAFKKAYGDKNKLNLANIYNPDYPVIFNIMLWFGVAMFFSLLAISMVIGGMDPVKDVFLIVWISIPTKNLHVSNSYAWSYGWHVVGQYELWHQQCFVCAQCFRTFPEGVFYEFEGRKYCEHDFHVLFAPCCGKCGEFVIGRVIKAMNANWHPNCFRCEMCTGELADSGFIRNAGRALCHECNAKAKAVGLGKYVCHKCHGIIDDKPLRFRGEVYHPYHFNCTACHVELDSNAREVRSRPGFAANDMNELYCLRCHDKMGIPICGACRRPIEERVVTALGKHWHVEHFVCAKCEKPFFGHRHYEKKGLAYCETHYHQLFGNLCFVCNQVIAGDVFTAMNKAWCVHHFACSVCDQKMNQKTKFYEFDLKPVCKKCYEKFPGELRRRLRRQHEATPKKMVAA